MVCGWGLLGVSPAEPGPGVLVHVGCHLPLGVSDAEVGTAVCSRAGAQALLAPPMLLQPPGAPQSGLG